MVRSSFTSLGVSKKDKRGLGLLLTTMKPKKLTPKQQVQACKKHTFAIKLPEGWFIFNYSGGVFNDGAPSACAAWADAARHLK
jgi:hypothetical protein